MTRPDPAAPRQRSIRLAGWRPGAHVAVRNTAELVSEFLLVTEHLPAERAAEIAGVSQRILRRWRDSPRRSIRSTARERIHRYLAEREAGSGVARRA
jgi:hypothetical protein